MKLHRNTLYRCLWLIAVILFIWLSVWDWDQYLRIEGTAPPGMSIVVKTTVWTTSTSGRYKRDRKSSTTRNFSAKADANGHYSLRALVKSEPVLPFFSSFFLGKEATSSSVSLYLSSPRSLELGKIMNTHTVYEDLEFAAGLSLSGNPGYSSATLTCELTIDRRTFQPTWDCGRAWAKGFPIFSPLPIYSGADPFVLNIQTNSADTMRILREQLNDFLESFETEPGQPAPAKRVPGADVD